MKHNNLKLSVLSAAIMLTLAGCGGSDSNNATEVREDNAPQANNMTVTGARQWIPVTGDFDVVDIDKDIISLTFSENGEAVPRENDEYRFSHGILRFTHYLGYSYTSLTGKSGTIEYTATARGKSDSGTITIPQVTGDPLSYQQWHLRNTGQKAYALSDEMKAGLIELYIGRGETEEEATAKVEGWFEEDEAKLIAGEDINVLEAYAQGVTGEGVTAVVVDSGLELAHEDLEPNVLPNRSLNLNDGAPNKTDPSPTSISGDHGTSVAGLIAAKGGNGLGGQGVAPDTSLIGMNYLGSGKVSQTEFLIHGFPGSGISKSDNVGVFNRSYGLGWPTHFSYSELDEAIESYPNLNLRDGKGAVSMKSSGNSFEDDRNEGSVCSENGANELGLTCYNASFEPSQVHPYYLSVAAVNTDGKHTSYSAAGANVFVSAPSGEYGRYAPAMVTTDQMTCLSGYSGFNGGTIAAWEAFYGTDFVKSQFPFNYPGHEENASCNYTSTFNGTSSAAPNASGVVALILSANPSLTWRDIRHILASTSTMNDPENEAISYKIGETDFVAHQGWIENAAGFNFNNLYGFGRVNAGDAVAMAKSYNKDLGEQVTTDWIGEGSAVDEEAMTSEIPDNSATGLTYKITVTEDLAVEAMQFKFDISNVDMWFGDSEGNQTTAGMDLAIEVTSPSGTKSIILSGKQAITYPSYSFENGDQPGYILKDGVFLSNAFYGESSQGEWTIKLLDTSAESFATADGGAMGYLGYKNNAAASILEGIAVRAYGHEK